MTTETFDWSEKAEQKRLTVVLPADTDVTEDDAREAIDALVDGDTGEQSGEDTTGETDAPRRFARGYTGGEGA